MDSNPSLSQLRLCTYNIFAWRTARFKPNEELVASLFQRLDADVYSMNEVMAPTQQWFHFLLSLDAKFGELDSGNSAPKASDSASSSSSEPGSARLESNIEDLRKSHASKSPSVSSTGGKKVADTSMLDYEHLQKKYQREGRLSESDVSEAISRLAYYAGKAFGKSRIDAGLSNALIVNRRRGKVFEGSKDVEFENQLLATRGVETRGACHVILDHPIIGTMKIYTLHLDHRWERNRQAQLEQLMESILCVSNDSIPHIIMGDFNAIEKGDYTEKYEDGMITTVRRKGGWEEPTYTLTKHMSSLGYIDFWRRCNPKVFDADVTTCAYDTRIDYVWISKDFEKLVDWSHANTYCHILNNVSHSDHYPVLANLQFKPKDVQ